MLTKTDIPYWRLSGFYFFYFAFLGAWVPFWNLYLEEELHFGAEAIGIITSGLLATKIIGPLASVITVSTIRVLPLTSAFLTCSGQVILATGL